MQDKTFFFRYLFALSGFAGLIYEGMWAKYLKLLIGHSSYGQILTLFVFMGGLALGSFLSARVVDRVGKPLLWYVVIEILIGMLGFVFHDAFTYSRNALWSSGVLGNLGAFTSMGVSVLLGLVLTLPQAVLLGATFPFAVSGIMRATQSEGHRSIPALYFANSIGAALGILVMSFVLVPRLGLPGTLVFAACLNLIVALGFLLLQRDAVHEVLGQRSKEDDLEESLVPSVALLLLVAFGTGMTSFFYEIGWIRLLALILGSSTHAFDLMLSAFILGLGIGSFYIWATSGNRQLQVRLAKAQIYMGIAASLGIFGAEALFRLQHLSHSFLVRGTETWGIHALFQLLVCVLLMCPTSFFAGMTLPLLTTLLVRSKNRESYLGHVYGWNTLGSILGATIGSLLLLPLLGVTRLVAFGALLDVGLGVMLLRGVRPFRGRMPLVAGALAIVVASVFWVLPEEVLVSGGFRRPSPGGRLNADSLWVEHGRTATVSVAQVGATRVIATNGKADGSVSMKQGVSGSSLDELTQAMCAWLPMVYHPSPRNVAMVGMGTGMSAHFLMADQRVERLDLVEIEPKMLELSERLRPVNERAFTDPRVVNHIEDARTFLARSGRKYDVIISEPSNPWVSGVSSLFTDEFYRDMQRNLAPGGVLLQWVQAYEFNDSLFASILQSLSKVYPHVKIHAATQTSDLIFIASMQPLSVHMDALSTAMVSKDLKYLRQDPGTLLTTSLLGTERLLDLMDGYSPPNSEFAPFVDLNAERAMFAQERVDVLKSLVDKDVPLQRWLEPGWDSIAARKNQVRASMISSSAVRSFGFRPDCREGGDAACWDKYLGRLLRGVPVSTWPHRPGGVDVMDSLRATIKAMPDTSLGLYVKWRLGDTAVEPDSLTRYRAAVLLRQGLQNELYRKQVLWAGLFWGDPLAMGILEEGIKDAGTRDVSLETHMLVGGLARWLSESRSRTAPRP